MALTPMMTQYLATKEKHKDAILFYRLGDFYELFFEDAIKCSKLLDITLTGKDCGLETRAPMCGVPYHAVESYVGKLIENGEKVAICEQLTVPEKGKIVERDVVRIITPGTVFEDSMLDEGKNNYICSIFKKDFNIGVSYADITTGDFYTFEFIE
ncbi:MAG: DNA mismatch repair protein MutS, partial [Clostridia bacterium]